MWMINDFPAYGMLFGWMMEGKLACLICMEDTKVFTLKYGGKNSQFDCYKRFLDIDHTYRHSRYGFRKNTIEIEEVAIRIIGQQIWGRVSRLPKITEVEKSI